MKKPAQLEGLSSDEVADVLKEAMAIVKRRKNVDGKGVPAWKKEWKKQYAGQTAKCPVCGDVKPIDDDFGPRRYRGKVGRQSYCRDCRKSINYHNRPRVYNTQNS